MIVTAMLWALGLVMVMEARVSVVADDGAGLGGDIGARAAVGEPVAAVFTVSRAAG